MGGTEGAGAVGRPSSRFGRLAAGQRLMVADLTLDTLLRQVVQTAADVVGADTVAVLLRTPTGRPGRVVHSGIGGAVLIPPRSAADGPDAGPARALLTVPLRSAGVDHGQLTLVRLGADAAFCADDRELAASLAATAAVAVENARLHASARRRSESLAAAAAVSDQLLAGADEATVLDGLSRTMRRLARSHAVAVVTPAAEDPTLLRVLAESRLDGIDGRGTTYPAAGSAAATVIATGRSTLVADPGSDPQRAGHIAGSSRVRHLLALPLEGEVRHRGAILVVRITDDPFSPLDVEVATAFAAQASVALERAEERGYQRRRVALEARTRIAEDLTLEVVHAIFSAGLSVEGVAAHVGDPAVRAQLSATVDNLDEAARDIRSSVFQPPEPLATSSLTDQLLSAVTDVAELLGFEPSLALEGPLDEAVDAAVATEVVAVVRESLTNVAKHAHARRVEVSLVARQRRLTVVVTDDGVGLGPSARRSGLANLRRRAEQRDGSLVVDEPPGGGLRLRWTIPIQHGLAS